MSILQRLRNLNPWHFVWISVLLSELFTLASNSLLSLLWWGAISRDLLLIGSIDALVVALLVAPLAIYFVRHQGRLHQVNQALEDDIKARRRMEVVLRDSEERYRTIFEKSGDAIFILSGQEGEAGRIVAANQAAADMHGFTIEELCAMGIGQVDTPESAALSGERLKRILAGEWLKFEVEHLRKDGSIFPLEVTAGTFEVGDKRYVMAFDRDITARRRAEELLRQSEERFRRFADEASFDGIIVHDQGTVLDVSEPFARMHGYARWELIGHQALETVAPSHREQMRRNIASGEESQYESLGLRQDGSTFPVEIRVKNLILHGRSVRTAVVRDITDRKRAESELRQSEASYRSLVENVPYGLLICDAATGSFLYVNDLICQLSGYSQQELAGLTFWEITDPADHPRVRERLRLRLAGQQPAERAVYTGLRKDGSRYLFEVTVSLVTHQGRPALQGFVRDVTEQENLEKQLLRAQKLEALGTLAGGVAHEFNNILMAVRGYTQLMAGKPGLAPSVREYLGRIDEISKRAANLTSNMLGFARLESGEVGLVDPNQILQGMASLLRQTLPPDIVLRLEPQAGISSVKANTSQLEQVLLNLALNARDAMPRGGTITFRSREHLGGPEFQANHAWAGAGRYDELMVEDNGPGMDEEVLQHIFEPFFTTKEPGKGTGLGLSVAFSIVRNHGGELVVESTPGQGTRFSIFLPAQALTRRAAAPAAVEMPLPQGRGQRILVVDDEYSVRQISREALEAFGYAVEEATDGQEALRLFSQARQAGQGYDLVILDLSMPHMGGRECLRRLRCLDIESKVIIATGHPDSLEDLGLAAEAHMQVLHKPYDLSTLLKQTGHMLASAWTPVEKTTATIRIH
ncbi:MAG: PAS domain S-box protein [Pseudomonadota bacterium]